MKATKTPKIIERVQSKPILKWAGGKTQLIEELVSHIPQKYNRYIEPFIGGGALFFHLQPQNSIISDLNPELVNLYKCIASNPKLLIRELSKHKNNKEYFYAIRSQRFEELSKYEAAARTIFLNRTCFNGLFRVNKSGQFNVPFANYNNPKICDEENIFACSEVLKKSLILHADYKNVLRENASEGDLIFLDPPYLPISTCSDFKRYTKEQFYEEDQVELAELVKDLNNKGCHIILTNSNHPLVHELYKDFKIEVIKTKRNINSKGKLRLGEDVIVSNPINKKFKVLENLGKQIEKYPSTRYMGSKNKLLDEIWSVAKKFEFETVLDLFSGSGVVSYMFKTKGKRVISNDYLSMSANFTKALVENNKIILEPADVKLLLKANHKDKFVSETFKGLYFTGEENTLIDSIKNNIPLLKNEYKRAIAYFALTRACMKKRPRGIFTYVGYRYDDGRKDLQKSLRDHFVDAIKDINSAVFDNKKKNISRRGDALNNKDKPDLVYIDPPYYSPLSDNEYVRRYHFVEGLNCNWENVDMQWETKTKKFKSYPTPFSSRVGAYDAFDKLFKKYQSSIIVVSYSSNSIPTLDDMVSILSKYKSKVEVVAIDHVYSFGNRQDNTKNKNKVLEYLFIGY